jgi:N utilization substance protein B
MVTDMGMRRRGRETALQVLYQLDVQPELPVDAAMARFQAHLSHEAADESAAGDPSALAEARAFAERLVRGVVEHLGDIDARIGGASRNWRLERMARVDRNLLRLAVYEMAFCDDVPAKVAINEAIEIAKRFGASETSAFVNGVLDRVLEELPR